MPTCIPADLVADAECFACLSKQQLQAVIAQLLCNINFSGGGGGQAQTPWQQNINANGFNLTQEPNAASSLFDISFPADLDSDPVSWTYRDGGLSFNGSGAFTIDTQSFRVDSDSDIVLRPDFSSFVLITYNGTDFFKVPSQQSGKSAVVGATSIAVVFTTAMPDANYSVALTGSAALVAPFISAISSTGFTVSLTAFTGTMYWTATQNTQ